MKTLPNQNETCWEGTRRDEFIDLIQEILGLVDELGKVRSRVDLYEARTELEDMVKRLCRMMGILEWELRK